ncbi:MAG: hypothetical protein J6Y39_06820 [Bacteroidaceae bacterium]|nr:hypothetical protein [Bacteroidaceae bacterium]
MKKRSTPTLTIEQVDERKVLMAETQKVLKDAACAKAYKKQTKKINKFLKKIQ